MSSTTPHNAVDNATQILQQVNAGDRNAAEQLFPLVYDEFRAMAARRLRQERPDHTLQPTALVHEAYMKLIDQTRINWQGRQHFFAIAAQAMRRVLIDHARQHRRQKRGGGRAKVSLDETVVLSPQRSDELILLDETLQRLAQVDPRQARIVELRFFGGLTVEEAAQIIGVSKRTVEGDWTMAKAWLKREMENGLTD